MSPAILKPKEMRRSSTVVFTSRDGREICNSESNAGRSEYRWRTLEMLERQGGRCCICQRTLRPNEAFFEHQDGRGHGGGNRDDRITLPDGTWINGASCWECNSEKGSRRMDYNKRLQK